ncbi:hypothetical protein SDRG_06410 [Saprolegnia diclina VS20]|uniref:Uncharacterized protein n=1 Tax=Saprolegnia diclina (strain VS20) TaxID=1156394 RepID=T0QQW6_SAPDV|nr:hypothetical protein SDRG_06410 [Saprolegnia diclina VS20]EQC36305.1 hypothetical protein SDRG_06410 [Saprolegnia diclina VS20]|eukprot:XP_008610411.1 hypothetical protein SDRG_06410 [Saprolegnia diclina VS20]
MGRFTTCLQCSCVYALRACIDLAFPVQQRQWRCLPCTLPPVYAAAHALFVREHRAIADVATHFELDRAKLLLLVRWHRAHAQSTSTLSTRARAVGAAMASESPLYTKEMLQAAVRYAALHGVGCRQAARAIERVHQLPLNSIPHGTVHQHMQSPSLRYRNPGAHRKLSRFEEELVAQHLIQKQETRRLTKHEAAEEMMTLLCRRGRANPFEACAQARPSQGFWRGFLQRHPEIQLQTRSSPCNRILDATT